MALYLIQGVNLGIVSNWTLMSPVGLTEALGALGAIDAEDHKTLKDVLAGLKNNLDAAGIRTNAWSIPLARFKSYPPGREASEILRAEIAPELRRIPDAVFTAAADQTTISLKAGLDIYFDVLKSVQIIEGKHPSDFIFQAWVSRVTGGWASAADDYGVIADSWRRRGNHGKAEKAYRLEAKFSFKAARQLAAEKSREALEESVRYCMKALVAYEQIGEEAKFAEVLELKRKIEESLAGFVVQTQKTGFMGRILKKLESGAAVFFDNMRAAGPDAVEMEFHRRIHEERAAEEAKGSRRRPSHLRLVK